MDLTLIKTLLDSQNQAYRGALEVFMKQITDNVQRLESTVSDLRSSLEFTQKDLEDLKQEVKKQEKKNDQEVITTLQENLQASEMMIKELEDRTNYQEDYNRQNNLQITGVEEQAEGETWEQTAIIVNKLLEDKLQLPNIHLERAHRVGRRDDDHRSRPIIARFQRFGDREAVMRNVTKLHGTRIFINVLM